MKTSQIGTHPAGIGQRGWVGAFESAHVTFAGSTLLTLVPVGEGITELHVDWSNNYDDVVLDPTSILTLLLFGSAGVGFSWWVARPTHGTCAACGAHWDVVVIFVTSAKPVEDSRDVVKGKRRAGSGGHGRAATSAAGEVVPPVLPELRALPAQRGRRRCNPESLLVR
ncbi:hypothetical protein B296_00016616 [Ensete ventricosum]|uniref:Uncharacterized protein n=1 Tax=Ensete ventricosum TaxID=4639 RepID=A0A426Y7J9_ENSVE|nr:hypothetical protein B296_00016616 [Ensete ventricosum]